MPQSQHIYLDLQDSDIERYLNAYHTAKNELINALEREGLTLKNSAQAKELNAPDPNSELSERIKNARLNAGMTQAQVANALGVTFQAISNYERGVCDISYGVGLKLCEIFHISRL